MHSKTFNRKIPYDACLMFIQCCSLNRVFLEQMVTMEQQANLDKEYVAAENILKLLIFINQNFTITFV